MAYDSAIIDVDAFCADNGIDEDAAIKLRECDYDTQCLVIGRGPLSDARNPSSVLLSRIRQANQGMNGLPRKPKIPGGDRAQLNRDIENFVRDNYLDERANTCLMESEEEVCREVFKRPLKDARNPSAVVLSLIRQVKHDLDNGVPFRDNRKGGKGGDKGGKGYDKGKGKGKDWDWWSWTPSWDSWGKGGDWGGDSWGKGGDWGGDSWGKDGGKGKGGWDDGKGWGKGKGRSNPY